MRNRRRSEAGFTLMELMVVLAIIALIVAFSMPKIMKAVDKTKITDGVTLLSAVGSQTLAQCAIKGASWTGINTAFVQGLVADMPNGYSAQGLAQLTRHSGTCPNFTLRLAPDNGSGLPYLCIRRVGDSLRYAWSGGTGWVSDDIPVPTGKQASPFTGC
ncbi:type II secretion system protein [Elusimicrobiota bacterium]